MYSAALELECSVYSAALELECSVYSAALELECSVYSAALELECSVYSAALELECSVYSAALELECSVYSAALELECSVYSAALELECSVYSAALELECSVYSAALELECSVYSSGYGYCIDGFSLVRPGTSLPSLMYSIMSHDSIHSWSSLDRAPTMFSLPWPWHLQSRLTSELYPQGHKVIGGGSFQSFVCDLCCNKNKERDCHWLDACTNDCAMPLGYVLLEWAVGA